MPVIASMLVTLVRGILWVLNIAMLVRAILSWFPGTEDSPVSRFLAVLTEPIIMPVRALFNKMGWFQDMPLDISFFVTYLLISIIASLI